MSRQSRQLALEAEELWPKLQQFLSCYFREDWVEEHGSSGAALERAVADWDLAGRRLVLREIRDWNARRGWKRDMRASLNFGLGVNLHFATEEQARNFMNDVYDRVIVSVRRETRPPSEGDHEV
ncbi:hypothetical protein [Sphingosinicella terrae]|uniref:hypothetical protein n=1 Tax=Sphingosinicella terrae TaxID=2172047 RepID=UPI000E0D9C46|nr:hypothetical protein [Sphingosinicella terrae]